MPFDIATWPKTFIFAHIGIQYLQSTYLSTKTYFLEVGRHTNQRNTRLSLARAEHHNVILECVVPSWFWWCWQYWESTDLDRCRERVCLTCLMECARDCITLHWFIMCRVSAQLLNNNYYAFNIGQNMDKIKGWINNCIPLFYSAQLIQYWCYGFILLFIVGVRCAGIISSRKGQLNE